MKMIYKNSLFLLVVFVLMSCNSSKKDSLITENKTAKISEKRIEDNKGLLLLQQKCYACHSITSKSHDEIIAPPMVAVKRRYKMSYTNEDEFVEALTAWVINPDEDNALMRGAISNFNVMPKQPFNTDEINLIAAYMYNNTLEVPDWFDKHFTEEHPNGMGNGNGNGNRKGNGNGKGNGYGMGRGNGKINN